ncbi:hypothetical protein [Brevibacillus choshinensis]|uniref:hypothetical protein n=1 Tax=Brevibacillus choshinensis TaxID=54911 RepID=UPI002E1A6B90|nr:hypothetical protein [Brevibacillus choshinensis]
MEYAVGDTVTWESQSQGSFKEKTGKVLAIILPEEDLYKPVPEGIAKTRIKGQRFSSIARALVEVPREALRFGSDYYAPHVNMPRRVLTQR